MENKYNEEETLSENIMIAIITEAGNVSWISTDIPTSKQYRAFQKMFAVSTSPSIILRLILFIEIMILKILFSFEFDENSKGTSND